MVPIYKKKVVPISRKKVVVVPINRKKVVPVRVNFEVKFGVRRSGAR